jgi:hypothetical protein
MAAPAHAAAGHGPRDGFARQRGGRERAQPCVERTPAVLADICKKNTAKIHAMVATAHDGLRPAGSPIIIVGSRCFSNYLQNNIRHPFDTNARSHDPDCVKDTIRMWQF